MSLVQNKYNHTVSLIEMLNLLIFSIDFPLAILTSVANIDRYSKN